jgi:hypothetical protein
MIETTLPLAPEPWGTVRAPDPAPLLEQLATLRRENAVLRAENAVLQARVRELEARLGQHSGISSRPPSSDPPQAPVRPKAPTSGRKRGGQPGHRGAYRALLPVEQVDEVVVVPEVCRHCGQPLTSTEALNPPPPWRHQVVELLSSRRVRPARVATATGADPGAAGAAAAPWAGDHGPQSGGILS